MPTFLDNLTASTDFLTAPINIIHMTSVRPQNEHTHTPGRPLFRAGILPDGQVLLLTTATNADATAQDSVNAQAFERFKRNLKDVTPTRSIISQKDFFATYAISIPGAPLANMELALSRTGPAVAK